MILHGQSQKALTLSDETKEELAQKVASNITKPMCIFLYSVCEFAYEEESVTREEEERGRKEGKCCALQNCCVL